MSSAESACSSVGSCTSLCYRADTTGSVASSEGQYRTYVDAVSDDEDGKERRRRVFLVRNAERVDRVFPSAFHHLLRNPHQRYTPHDLNLPLAFPGRPGGLAALEADPPLTCLGEKMAEMVGEGLRLRGVPPTTPVFTSPSLRCVQTAAALTRGLTPPSATPLAVNVEPGLYSDSAPNPEWASAEALGRLGIRVNGAYKPKWGRAQALGSRVEARVELLWDRLLTESGGREVVAVTEAAGVDASARELLVLPTNPLTAPARLRLGLVYPYASLTTLEERRRGSWRFIPNDVLPISFIHTDNRVRNPDLFS